MSVNVDESARNSTILGGNPPQAPPAVVAGRSRPAIIAPGNKEFSLYWWNTIKLKYAAGGV